jgi:hypothetical protein
MLKVLISLSIALPMLQGCALFAGGSPTVTTQRAGCSSLIPADWANGTPAAAIGSAIAAGVATVADWQVQADREAARGDVADDRTKATIHIVSTCEARDAAAVAHATRRRFLGIF